MKRAILTQDAIGLEKSEAVVISTHNQLQESLDCPDCSDTMIKFYDWDKMKYLCENCGLTIANPAIVCT
jgi:ribosomal protein S27E